MLEKSVVNAHTNEQIPVDNDLVALPSCWSGHDDIYTEVLGLYFHCLLETGNLISASKINQIATLFSSLK